MIADTGLSGGTQRSASRGDFTALWGKGEGRDSLLSAAAQACYRVTGPNGDLAQGSSETKSLNAVLVIAVIKTVSGTKLDRVAHSSRRGRRGEPPKARSARELRRVMARRA